MTFSKLLVANRGEIACRVMETAQGMGYPCVAVYSDADAEAPHVAMADQAVRLGPAPAAESYLNVAAILEAARRTGADAIHPGYGFLSENANFAKVCKEAGLVFVGPPEEAIRVMGDKARAKERMIEAGVPCVPGYQGEDQSEGRFKEEAAAIGYPLLVKASAGGGGRGMRRVVDEAQLTQALQSARAEAESAFGSGDLLLEKLVTNARHVEVQVFGDSHGNVLHFGERDCSVQRRHQKVIEEAPSPAVDTELRAKMGAAAVAAAKAVKYVGAGTVEFLLDDEGNFYFLEMNTRLQVEHPVTEEAYPPLDLVETQLRVAAGGTFTELEREMLSVHPQPPMHAIEVRVYAEDPYAGYMPQTGRVVAWEPADDLFARIDAGLVEGGEVTAFYDPMVAKVIVSGEDRFDAIRKLKRALAHTVLLGFRHNKQFLFDLLDDPIFRSGRATTDYLDASGDARFLRRPTPSPDTVALAAALWVMGPDGLLPDGYRNAHFGDYPLDLWVDDEVHHLRVTGEAGGVRVHLEGGDVHVQALAAQGARVRVQVDDYQHTSHLAFEGAGRDLVMHLETPVGKGGGTFRVREVLPEGKASDTAGTGRIAAPSSGKVLSVLVSEGERVEKGQTLLTLEAMKIESAVVSDVDGKVALISVKAGDQVKSGDKLAVVIPDETKEDGASEA